MPWREGELVEGSKDFRIATVVISLALTIAVCLGGYQLYKEYGVKRPLTASLLQVDGIQKVEVQEENDSQVILITMKNGAGLKTVYQEANDITVEKMGDKPYIIKIVDNPSPELSYLYDDLELGIHQGIANSSFIWLTEWIHDKTTPKNAEYRIQVDNRNLYLTLNKGDHYLTRIIERDNGTKMDGREDTDA